ncbi:MAG: hypothetical protein WCF94_00625 [bacterium]
MKNTIKLLFVTSLLVGAGYLYAWTGPTGVPPEDNLPTPIHAGDVEQTKLGNLILGDDMLLDQPTRAKLQVNGNALFGGRIFSTSNATATFSGGINLTGGCVAINGVCVGNGSISNNGWGTTSTDYWKSQRDMFSTTSADYWVTTKSLGSASQWTTSGANIYYTTGNVGIGTNAPNSKLDVNAGTTNYDPTLTFGAPSAISFETAGVELSQGVFTASPWAYWMQAKVSNNTAWPITLNPLGGNVGIGVVNPTATLEVAGQVKITGGAPAAGKVLTSDANGVGSWQALNTGNQGLGFSISDKQAAYDTYITNPMTYTYTFTASKTGNVLILAKGDISGNYTATIKYVLSVGGTELDYARSNVLNNVGGSRAFTLMGTIPVVEGTAYTVNVTASGYSSEKMYNTRVVVIY